MCFRESSSVCSHLMRCFDSITVWEKVEEVPWRTYPGRQSCALTQRHSLPLDYEALICSPSATTGPSYWSIAPNCREWTQTLKWFNSKHLLFCVNRCVTSNKQNRHSISAKTLPADCEAWRRRGDELGLIYSHRTWAPWSHWIMYEIQFHVQFQIQNLAETGSRDRTNDHKHSSDDHFRLQTSCW